MKLIVVMSIEQHADELRRLFREHQVPVFSETEVEGFRLHRDQNEGENWFSHRHVGVSSHVVFAFVEADKAGELMDAIAKRTREMDPTNPMRAFQLEVEKAV